MFAVVFRKATEHRLKGSEPSTKTSTEKRPRRSEDRSLEAG